MSCVKTLGWDPRTRVRLRCIKYSYQSHQNNRDSPPDLLGLLAGPSVFRHRHSDRSVLCETLEVRGKVLKNWGADCVPPIVSRGLVPWGEPVDSSAYTQRRGCVPRREFPNLTDAHYKAHYFLRSLIGRAEQ